MRKTSGRSRPAAAAHRRTARSTSDLLGHLSTDERNDRTGIARRFLALHGAVVLVGRPGGMGVGIPRWDLEVVQNPPPLDQLLGRPGGTGQLRQEPGQHLSPRFLTQVQVEALHSLLRGLMASKTGPLATASPLRLLRMEKVTFSLRQPVTSTIGQGLHPAATLPRTSD